MKEVEEAYMTIAEDLMEKGKLEGKIDDKQQVFIRLLKKKFSLSTEEEQEILSVRDATVLDKALDEIITAETKEEVLRVLS